MNKMIVTETKDIKYLLFLLREKSRLKKKVFVYFSLAVIVGLVLLVLSGLNFYAWVEFGYKDESVKVLLGLVFLTAVLDVIFWSGFYLTKNKLTKMPDLFEVRGPGWKQTYRVFSFLNRTRDRAVPAERAVNFAVVRRIKYPSDFQIVITKPLSDGRIYIITCQIKVVFVDEPCPVEAFWAFPTVVSYKSKITRSITDRFVDWFDYKYGNGSKEWDYEKATRILKEIKERVNNRGLCSKFPLRAGKRMIEFKIRFKVKFLDYKVGSKINAPSSS